MSIRACFEDYVSPLPWLVIDQTPLVACAGVIDCEQDIPRMDGECLAAYGCEFEYTSQRKNVLGGRIVVPVEGRMGRRFLEVDGFGFDQLIRSNAATDHMGIPVRTGIEMKGSDHFATSSRLLMFNIAAVSTRTCRQRSAFSIRD
jgi:hypothetical protein